MRRCSPATSSPPTASGWTRGGDLYVGEGDGRLGRGGAPRAPSPRNASRSSSARDSRGVSIQARARAARASGIALSGGRSLRIRCPEEPAASTHRTWTGFAGRLCRGVVAPASMSPTRVEGAGGCSLRCSRTRSERTPPRTPRSSFPPPSPHPRPFEKPVWKVRASSPVPVTCGEGVERAARGPARDARKGVQPVHDDRSGARRTRPPSRPPRPAALRGPRFPRELGGGVHARVAVDGEPGRVLGEALRPKPRSPAAIRSSRWSCLHPSRRMTRSAISG